MPVTDTDGQIRCRAQAQAAAPDRRHYGTGVGWSLTSAFLWATTYISGRFLMSADAVDPVTLSMLRFAVGGSLLMLMAALLFRRKLFAVSLTDLARLAALGALGVAGMSLLFFFGQRTVSAITSVLIMQTTPFMICLGSVLMGERIGARGIAGILVSLSGCMLVIGVFGGGADTRFNGQTTGCLLIFLSAFCWAVYSVLSKPLVERLGGLTASAWTMCFGALALAAVWAVGPFTRTWPSTPTTWSIVAYIAVFPTAVAFLAWYEAMVRIPLSLLNVMQYLTPVFTILLARLILGERMTWTMVAGTALVLLGVALSSEQRPRFAHPRDSRV